MLITRTSVISNITRSLDLPITEEQYSKWYNRELLIQDAMPNLTDDEREFILTGITSEEWDATFKQEDEEILSDEEPASLPAF